MGAAKIGPGITFTAQTTLDVREWPEGLPADKVRVSLTLTLPLA